ncbi:hypothetical protein BCR36DRAFT_412800 [Piromyces finnis]|uniref:Altered inheritance of mitochondria protein 24, mitochondrial n=1 Tax=Piromyces finnis TaxID=1754191 RepID=A0A1Y1V7Y2_9FUNG|nr:hypothetical protein BCR36DRAFT_412800 [Piromyces finnis]|eukprot:ORX49278.1 hypothetical protein BCR36DRAFT_412800 [Piromyces finnis]
MLCKLSILNTKTNKLLVLNNTYISTKLFSTISSKGRPTWRITYNEDDEESEYNDISITQKSFGNVTLNNVTPKKEELSVKSSNNLKIKNISNSNSRIELPNKNVDKKQIINKAKSTKQKATYNNPEFEIIKSTNSESILFAKMKKNSMFYAKYGTVVGLSSKVRIELSYEDNTDEVLKGGNGSGIFAFEKVWTENNSGQVLLVPVKGDLMLINVKKDKEYVVKGKSLFGAVSSISVNDYYHNNHKFEGVKYFIVKGKGTIAIEGEGGVLEITLNEDEHFLVKPSTLLAFESQMSVKPVLSSACTEEIEEDILEKQDNDSSFWKKAKGMIDRAKIYVSGDQLFYRLKGPGKFYISTRIPSLSGLQAFKLNNKDKKKANKTIQKRNYSTNSKRPQALDEYEPELENEISSLQKKLMEKTLNNQINKKINKKSKTPSVSKKQPKNDRYPDTSNHFNEEEEENENENENEITEESPSYQSIIDEKAVLYKRSDKVKSPKSSMFFSSRESTDETNVEKSLIKTPKVNTIDVYLDEDIGEALIKETNKNKNNKFSLSSHQNKNLKTMINSEVKENKDRKINTMLEKRTAEIKAEKKRKRQQELNPKRYINKEEEDNDEQDIDEKEEVLDGNEENFEDDEDEIIEEEVEEEEEEEEIIEEEEDQPEPKSKKVYRNNQKNQNKKVIKIENEPEETEKKVWVMKENIKENKFFTFDDKNPMTIQAISKNKKSTKDSDSSFKSSSLKKKSTTKKLKKSSNLSKKSQLNTRNLRRNNKNIEKDIPKQNQPKSMNKAAATASNKGIISSKRKPSQKIIVKKNSNYENNYYDNDVNDDDEEIIDDKYDNDDEVVEEEIDDDVIIDDDNAANDEEFDVVEEDDVEEDEEESNIVDEDDVAEEDDDNENIIDENDEEYVEDEEEDNGEYVEDEE